uniref:Uncharacterized protein n=1 Tax=Anguilla anguilla TaxID=7936 RepID=A0A0E9SYL6_ANGAN
MNSHAAMTPDYSKHKAPGKSNVGAFG